MTVETTPQNDDFMKKRSTIDVSPAKSFFVQMLTRDIALSDAILDLLDNCVDGILRSKITKEGNVPYISYRADITINKDCFIIEDNCGGIPWTNREYAFKLGRPADRQINNDSTIGTYGIGMKRAIFKMGEHAAVYTKTNDTAYKVIIDKPWLTGESWELPLDVEGNDLSESGTKIVVTDLLPGVSAQFMDNDFLKDLKKQISSLYAFILAKGFCVKVNGEIINGRPTQLIFSEETNIKPYIYKDQIDDVEVFLAVGFTRPIPSPEEIDENDESASYSSLDAGWTIVCNDRAVLYCNRDELTGWGEAGIPQYHTQFIAISGIVEFRCKNAQKLPMTTTKRGIDASSRLYLQVKNKMREGMKLFITYTNRWKKDWEEGKNKFSRDHEAVTISGLKQKIIDNDIELIDRQDGSAIFMPKLPMPPQEDSGRVKISFSTQRDNPRIVARYIYGEDDANRHTNNEVGEDCFKYFLKKADK